ncbi:MAG: tetratricopeptide repeat protein [Candidatus Omnitrophica bacterium]|nr:tetratricopeptide repeat protein [Candidatus Omnitrophota bacterium]
MNHSKFTELRKSIDEAITFNNLAAAQQLAEQGLQLAQYMEVLGEIMFFKAQFEIINENYDTAISYLDKAIKYNPSDGAAYNDRALCMVDLGMIDGVLEYFDKGIDAEPDFATIYHNKGWFLNKLGQHHKALDCLKKTLALESNRPVTYENIADVYSNLGKKKKAIQAYEKALDCLHSSYENIIKQIHDEIQRLKE